LPFLLCLMLLLLLLCMLLLLAVALPSSDSMGLPAPSPGTSPPAAPLMVWFHLSLWVMPCTQKTHRCSSLTSCAMHHFHVPKLA
jgi:hypothetical protein